ncbi:MAG TPA: hypothetical protein VN031_03230 [Candidatus Microsaccharimonas sp.]|nr:hypothetical protein [Candidatus Microsaccharimonas sp.]
MNPDTTNTSGNGASLPVPGPAQQPTPMVAPPAAPSLQAGNTPAVAADGDRIEPEWIAKLKQIVGSTQTDPHEQARQLAALRADYMMKRYNKEIKLGE